MQLKEFRIITLVIIGVTPFLTSQKIIDAATYMTLAEVVITYYFNRKEM